MRYMGMDVIASPYLDDCPRMTVDPHFASLMPRDFVDGLNAWMREFFGTESRCFVVDPVAARMDYIGTEKRLYMGLKLFEKLLDSGELSE